MVGCEPVRRVTPPLAPLAETREDIAFQDVDGHNTVVPSASLPAVVTESS